MRVSATEVAWLVGVLLVSGLIAGVAYLVVVVLAEDDPAARQVLEFVSETSRGTPWLQPQ